MIAISTPTFDLNGSLVIKDYDPATDISSLSRRVSRTATLDGGCEIEDKGLSHGDRTFSIQFPASLTDANALKYLVESYLLLKIATAEGMFTGAVENLRINAGEITATIFIKEKLT